MNKEPTPWKGIIFMLISGSCWGFHGILIKYGLSLGASFLQILLAEVFLATVFFSLLAKSFFRTLRPQGARQWLSLGAIGLATIGIGFFLFLSYSLGPVAIPATLMFLYLPVVYGFSVLSGHQRILKGKIFAIVCVIIGAIFTTRIFSTFNEPGAIPAVWAALAASMCYAVVFILTPSIAVYTTAEFRSFAVSSMGFLGCFVILLCNPSLWHDLGENSLQFFALALLLGVVGQIIPVITLMKGLPLTGGSLGGVLASIELPIAVFSAALLLGESLTVSKVFGIALVLSGIVFYNFAESRHSLLKFKQVS